ncbi:GntR family transcriptional regulator [Anopheles sinensis]|uniref:GntR family transcriptional regulator n=1 Tax=Anopheles sinensis TaxID=74873 RepID=A0A084VHZ9_ANOSI|nr:GntR family transcriptional regulator [Anopheles sinensis]
MAFATLRSPHGVGGSSPSAFMAKKWCRIGSLFARRFSGREGTERDDNALFDVAEAITNVTRSRKIHRTTIDKTRGHTVGVEICLRGLEGSACHTPDGEFSCGPLDFDGNANE